MVDELTLSLGSCNEEKRCPRCGQRQQHSQLPVWNPLTVISPLQCCWTCLQIMEQTVHKKSITSNSTVAAGIEGWRLVRGKAAGQLAVVLPHREKTAARFLPCLAPPTLTTPTMTTLRRALPAASTQRLQPSTTVRYQCNRNALSIQTAPDQPKQQTSLCTSYPPSQPSSVAWAISPAKPPPLRMHCAHTSRPLLPKAAGHFGVQNLDPVLIRVLWLVEGGGDGGGGEGWETPKRKGVQSAAAGSSLPPL